MALEAAEKQHSKGAKVKHPVCQPGDSIGEGDSQVIYDAFGRCENLEFDYACLDFFDQLKREINWQKMYHAKGEVPRLVCAQGTIHEDGSMPVYRHPSDESLPLFQFTPLVNHIRQRVEEIVDHKINHALIQLYRDGRDYISEHSDKTLDIMRYTKIVNVSFGAQRTMRLRTKKSASVEKPDGTLERKTQLIPLPNSSVFLLGWQTNMRWLHSINPDKRPSNERLESELAFNGQRISLTFRYIGTFLNSESSKIWGQGAISKSLREANYVINGDANKSQHLINAFGMENQLSNFDWDLYYGTGFDVLHFRIVD